MDFSCLLKTLLVTTLCVFVLSVCIGVCGCVCPISYSYWHDGMASLQLIKSVSISASSDDDITILVILAKFNTSPLLGGNAVFFYMENAPLLFLCILFQRGVRRWCGPLGPFHLYGMWVCHLCGCPHSLITISIFANLCSVDFCFLYCDGSKCCQRSRINCPRIIQKIPRDLLYTSFIGNTEVWRYVCSLLILGLCSIIWLNVLVLLMLQLLGVVVS